MTEQASIQPFYQAEVKNGDGIVRPVRILVVDDDEHIVRLNEVALRRFGYKVDTAGDGDEAWKAFERESYDLLITDHKMPNVTGVELIKKVRSARLALPIIMATGVWPTDEMSYYPWIQPVSVLLKPYVIQELLSSVRAALSSMPDDKRNSMVPTHGDLVLRLRETVTAHRAHDLIYFDPADSTNPYTYNPLKRVPRHLIPLAVSGLLEAFKKLWVNEWGVRMEHIIRNCIYALLESGEASLPDILRMLGDRSYRSTILERVRNEQVRGFWENEFTKYNPRYRQEAIAPIQNKVGAFLADPRLRRAVIPGGTDIRLREVMDSRKILLVNLGKGLFGDDSASFRAFGLDLVTDLCAKLLEGGAPGLHFYTLNQAGLSSTIWQRLGIS